MFYLLLVILAVGIRIGLRHLYLRDLALGMPIHSSNQFHVIENVFFRSAKFVENCAEFSHIY